MPDPVRPYVPPLPSTRQQEDEAAWNAANPNAVYNDPNSVATYRDARGYVQVSNNPQAGLGGRVAELNDPNSKSSNDFYYGGTKEAAQADVNRYRDLAAAFQARQGVQTDYTNANADRGMSLGARGDQTNAVGMYRDAANGVGTSVAQNQFAQALDASRRQQASMAASARGGGLARAAAQSQAMAGAADMTQNAAGAAATLRAQEIAQARAGYAGAAGQLRGSDQTQQSQDAQMAQSQSALNDSQRARNDQMWTAGENLGQGVQGSRMQAGQAIQNTIQGTHSIAAGAGAASGQQQTANNARDMQTAGAIGAVAGGVIGTVITPGAGTAAGAAAGGAAGSTIGQAASDERVKTDIHDGTAKSQEFLDALKAYDYEYKRPGAPGQTEGRHTSPMAQDLERSELGKRMVVDTPDGKMVDYKEGFATALAGMGTMNKRLDGLEAALRSRAGKGA